MARGGRGGRKGKKRRSVAKPGGLRGKVRQMAAGAETDVMDEMGSMPLREKMRRRKPAMED